MTDDFKELREAVKASIEDDAALFAARSRDDCMSEDLRVAYANAGTTSSQLAARARNDLPRLLAEYDRLKKIEEAAKSIQEARRHPWSFTAPSEKSVYVIDLEKANDICRRLGMALGADRSDELGPLYLLNGSVLSRLVLDDDVVDTYEVPRP